MNNKTIAFILAVGLAVRLQAQPFDPASNVNPFIGTGGAGHTYPGATLPYGMVQLSPDTRIDGSWEGCSGYHYSDSVMHGFTHTHLSGTGCSDYGDILLLPYSADSLPVPGKGVRFSHADEKASPGSYSVLLKEESIRVSLTATARTGFHRYEFPTTGKRNVLLDLFHRDKLTDGRIRIVSDRRIEGFRRSSAWASDQLVYFCIEFDRPFLVIGHEKAKLPLVFKKDACRMGLQFPGDGEIVQAKVALSSVSEKNAWMNLSAESAGWDFQDISGKARNEWNKELGRIGISGATPEEFTVFYTALYHCMVVPNIYSDINGEYRGRDGKVHKAEGYTHYTVFSLWDTFRAWHPLMTLIDRKRTRDYILTFLSQYRQGGLLPVWELSSNETECMIGYHAIPVIVHAWMSGIRDFDGKLALEAMRKSAESRSRFGLGAYMDGGRLTLDDEHESVSKTLEYAYDDWCIAVFAASLGDSAVYRNYLRRSQSWKNLFDFQTGFIRPVKNGGWLEPFDPYEVNNNFTEANAWQYTFFVPQDVPGLMKVLGGQAAFSAKLDDLFSANTSTTGREQADITGLIGQYAHGNEPSHNMAYLYDYAGQPWKTQERVRQILDGFYRNDPDGLIGNEDCGQMSAWYVMSALGFYPVTPGAGYYAIGTPLFPQAVVRLEDGRELRLLADDPGPVNKYVSAVSVNGLSLNSPFITHEQLVSGATVSFSMSTRPEKEWGGGDFPHPAVQSTDEILLTPLLKAPRNTFIDKMDVVILSNCDSIFYTIDGTVPDMSSERYSGGVRITRTGTLKAVAYKNGLRSSVSSADYFRLPHPDWKVNLTGTYTPQYSAGGPDGLVNGIRGTVNWRKGEWQGYQGQDFEAVVDMGSIREVRTLVAGFLQDVRPWIFFPKEVIFYTSTDGVNYTEAGRVKNDVSDRATEAMTKDFRKTILVKQARYVKVKAVNYGNLPEWHPGAGSPAYIFVDEIIVR